MSQGIKVRPSELQSTLDPTEEHPICVSVRESQAEKYIFIIFFQKIKITQGAKKQCKVEEKAKETQRGKARHEKHQ